MDLVNLGFLIFNIVCVVLYYKNDSKKSLVIHSVATGIHFTLVVISLLKLIA